MTVKRKETARFSPPPRKSLGFEVSEDQFNKRVRTKLGRAFTEAEGAERDRRFAERKMIPDSEIDVFMNWCRLQEKREIIRRLRKLRGGQSQKAFAAQLGMKPQQLSRYERGRVPDREVLVKIAAETGTRLAWLLTGEGEAHLTAEPHGLQARVAEDERQYNQPRRRQEDQERLEIAGTSLMDAVQTIIRSNNRLVIQALKINLEVFLQAIAHKPRRRKGGAT